MAARVQCPKCGGTKTWTLNDGRQRCARCRFDWRPGRLPLRLTAAQWRAVLRWFVRGVPSADIARETRLERKRVLRSLTVVRRAIQQSFPPDVRRAMLVETPAASRRMRTGRRAPRRSTKLPPRGPAVLGIYVAHGREWVDILPAGVTAELVALHAGRPLDAPLPPRFHRYAAVVYRGRLYRLPSAAAGRATVPFGRIEAFWAYLQRRLRAKGGIRRERLPLYLAEYVWRYHHRHLSLVDQARQLLVLIRQHPLKWKE